MPNCLVPGLAFALSGALLLGGQAGKGPSPGLTLPLTLCFQNKWGGSKGPLPFFSFKSYSFIHSSAFKSGGGGRAGRMEG